MTGLIIFATVEYFLIMLTIGLAVWICFRYRKKAAGWQEQAEAFQEILNNYEEGRYKDLKLSGPPEKKTKKKKAEPAEAEAR